MLRAPVSLIPDKPARNDIRIVEFNENPWDDLTFANLRELCRKNKIKATGRRSDLEARLREAGVQPRMPAALMSRD